MNSTVPINIAIDAMGGDFAPRNEVKGAIEFVESSNAGSESVVWLVGKEDELNKSLKELNYAGERIKVVHAENIISMHDDASSAFKKKDTSLYIGMELVRDGKVDAFVSAGNTGAVLSTATIVLGRIKGVSRPTIGAIFPTVTGKPAFVLDAGATLDLKARFLYEYAVMGSIFTRDILHVDNPKVGLINVGEEKSKGTKEHQLTNQMLRVSSLNFIGNVEGRDILMGRTADVFVCDGYTGNVILKLTESFQGFLKDTFKNFAAKSIFNKIKIGLFLPTMRKIFKQFDYQEYGGVPLLGVNGIVIIGHGKSTPLAIKNMLRKGYDMAKLSITKKIEEALQTDNVLKEEE